MSTEKLYDPAIDPFLKKTERGYEKTAAIVDANGKFIREEDMLETMADPETGITLTRSRREWRERYAEVSAAAPAKPEKVSPFADMEQQIREKFADIELIPTEQTLVKGATACKTLWGENMLLCVVVNPHAVKSRNSDLIIPVGDDTVQKAYVKFWEKSTIVRLVRISDNCDEKRYKGIKEARMRMALGKPGPILELKPGSGSPRKGANGEACIIVHAQHVWLEFPYDEPLTFTDRIRYWALRCLSALTPWKSSTQEPME